MAWVDEDVAFLANNNGKDDHQGRSLRPEGCGFSTFDCARDAAGPSIAFLRRRPVGRPSDGGTVFMSSCSFERMICSNERIRTLSDCLAPAVVRVSVSDPFMESRPKGCAATLNSLGGLTVCVEDGRRTAHSARMKAQ